MTDIATHNDPHGRIFGASSNGQGPGNFPRQFGRGKPLTPSVLDTPSGLHDDIRKA
jgi:hypothetical protein